jgi:hypothetical protein
VRKEIAQVARELKRNHRFLFIADPKLKDRVARLLRSLLPPKPRRRGRPRRKDVTTAILLLARGKYYGNEAVRNLCVVTTSLFKAAKRASG